MSRFSKEDARNILTNEIPAEALAARYPELKKAVLTDISKISQENGADKIAALIGTYRTKSAYAIDRIQKSGSNQKTLDQFLPEIIKARIALSLMEQLNLMAKSGKVEERVRLRLLDGFLLQKILFKKDLVRKPASLLGFRLVWPLIRDKKILMPLVNKKGIYCFYTKKFIKEVASLTGTASCLEIGAGDGTLTRFLKDRGVDCKATDDQSWKNYISYPEFVEKLDARSALEKYRPETVICSWPPPGNPFEKYVFETESVMQYIVIGTRSPLISGNYDTYQNQKKFTMEIDPKLSGLILPPSEENVVYFFKRK